MYVQLYHKLRGLCYLDDACNQLNLNNPDPETTFVIFDLEMGDIEEVSRSLVTTYAAHLYEKLQNAKELLQSWCDAVPHQPDLIQELKNCFISSQFFLSLTGE